MRAHLALVSAALVLSVATAAEARGSQNNDPHLRPAEPSAKALVADALDRSGVVRDLASRLKNTDVVAYVRIAHRRDGERESGIYFLGRTSHERYMVIRIDGSLSPDRQIALVGHELQHAVDMAETDWITDHERLVQYFTLNGWKLGSPESGFETLSALQTERQVARELATAAAAASNRSKPR